MRCPRNNWRYGFLSGSRCGATGLDLLQGLAAPRQLGLNGSDGRRPDEGLGVFIPTYPRENSVFTSGTTPEHSAFTLNIKGESYRGVKA